MSDDRPDPLVPPNVDISGLDGFILDVQKLFASELWALSTGDEFKAAVALWGRAWQQSPPGSLPKDDRILAAFSGAGKDWRKVRDMALHGFVECKDDRLYHRVLCQEVMNAHRKRQAFRDKTKAATEARRQRHEQRDVERDESRDDARDDQRDVVAEANVTSVKGKEKEKKNRLDPSDLCPKPIRTRHDYPPDFLEFWAAYPTDPNMGKREAFTEWEKLDDEERRQATTSCPSFVAHCKADPTYRPIHANRYLAKRRFEGHAAARTAKARDGQRIDFGGGIVWPETTVRNQLDHFRRDPATWPTDRLGPPPGTPGCRVPDRLLKVAA